MPASLLDLKRKIASVNQTGQITKAMQMVSAAKLSKTQNLDQGFVLFDQTMRQTLSHLMSDRIIRHLRKENISFNQENLANLDYADVFNLGIVADLIQPRKEVKNVGYLVIGGDRGLVGSYNSTIIKNMMQVFEQNQKQNIKVLAVGSVPAQFFKKRNLNVVYEYSGISDVPTFNEIRPNVSTIVKMYLDGVIDELYVCHTHFVNTLSSKFQIEKMLPIADLSIDNNEERADRAQLEFMIKPDLDTVLKKLLPQFARTMIYGMILDAKTAEHASSMTAMSSASDNAGDIVSDLTTQLNRARQAQITTEITEIIGGANALN
jgi:F-type H+-transporting ATPase subunit gamma